MQISDGVFILICAIAGYWLVSFILRKLSERGKVARPNAGYSGSQDDLSIEQSHRHVLGVSYDAGEHEIKTAYQQLLAKYHPDRVTHLGDEFLAIAGQKTKELTAAYEFFKKKYEW